MQFSNGILDWNGNDRPDPGDIVLEFLIFNSIFNEGNDHDEEDSDEDGDDFFGRSKRRR